MNLTSDFHSVYLKDSPFSFFIFIYDIFNIRAYINSYILFGSFDWNYNPVDNLISR